ncbi:hypothetical protein D3C80_2110530 [compost metagenome]
MASASSAISSCLFTCYSFAPVAPYWLVLFTVLRRSHSDSLSAGYKTAPPILLKGGPLPWVRQLARVRALIRPS